MGDTQNPSKHSVSYLPPVFMGSMAFVFVNFGFPIRADDLGITAFGIGGMYAVFTGTMLFLKNKFEPHMYALAADLALQAVRGRVMGAKETAAGVGAALGPLCGGYIYDHWAPQAAFGMNGVLLLCVAALTLLSLLWFSSRVKKL